MAMNDTTGKTPEAEASRRLDPRCNGSDVPCDGCGKLHYRRGRRLKSRAGGWWCSRACQYGVSKRLSFVCDTCSAPFTRFRSQSVNSKNHFCSRVCACKYGLLKVKCSWPGCSEEMDCRVTITADRRGRELTEYKTNLVKKGDYTKSVLCLAHKVKLQEYLGTGTRLSNARIRVFSDPSYSYGHRAVSNKLIRAVVFDRAGRGCEDCGEKQDFNAPSKTWEIDHVMPVFRGGLTAMSNLQLLCRACHDNKSSVEKSQAALERHSNSKLGRWMTHHEKDALIAELRGKLALYERNT